MYSLGLCPLTPSRLDISQAIRTGLFIHSVSIRHSLGGRNLTGLHSTQASSWVIDRGKEEYWRKAEAGLVFMAVVTSIHRLDGLCKKSGVPHVKDSN